VDVILNTLKDSLNSTTNDTSISMTIVDITNPSTITTDDVNSTATRRANITDSTTINTSSIALTDPIATITL